VDLAEGLAEAFLRRVEPGGVAAQKGGGSVGFGGWVEGEEEEVLFDCCGEGVEH